jgi:ankyrin repeat protein
MKKHKIVKAQRLLTLAEKGDAGGVRALLDGPQPPHPDQAKNSDGWTALNLAALYDHREVVALLLDKGADIEAKPDYEGECTGTSLIFAAASGHREVVALLLDKGADVEAKTYNGHGPCSGWTALIFAAQRGYREMVALLLDKGADVEAKDRLGSTALMIAADSSGYRGEGGVVALLLDRGANLEAKDNDGRTALIWAAQWGCPEVVALLLQRGADARSRDNEGKKAEDWAEMTQIKDLLRVRQRGGAGPGAWGRGSCRYSGS